jgi:hypothetical protein
MKMLSLIVLSSVLLSLQAATASRNDVAVLQAVLNERIYPEVRRFSPGGKNTIVLAHDRTVMICPPEQNEMVSCTRHDSIAAFERKTQTMRSLLFERHLSPEARQELGESYRERNRESQPLPALDGLIAVPPDQVREVQARESQRTAGLSGFSAPAYSSDGHALVYTFYACGKPLCGWGWYVLLKQRDGAWRVVDSTMIWIS